LQLEEARLERAAIERAKQELETRREELATEVGMFTPYLFSNTARILQEDCFLQVSGAAMTKVVLTFP
jgi:hypothetical protein